MIHALPRHGAALTRGLQLALLLCLAAGPWLAAQASALRYCDAPAPLDAAQKDKLFRFGAVIKTELEASGRPLALIARSGLDLDRFGVRYSHAGLSLKGSSNTPWSVRQLYYACDEHKPRVYDQGLSGFLLGLNDPASGYVSIVLLPGAEAAALEAAVLDNRQALRLLGATYSANAYAFSEQYQNCNQWVVEMLAAAWGQLEPAADLRAQAQRWLMAHGYVPSTIEVGSPLLMMLGAMIPWLHSDDHPPEEVRQMRFQVSMPAAIEAFVQASVPGATRLEFCHANGQVVIHEGWDAIVEGCVPGERDRVVRLD